MTAGIVNNPSAQQVRELCALMPQSSGWVCSKDAGHEPPCAAVRVHTGPPAADIPKDAAPAAPSSVPPPEPRQYGFKKRNEFDIELPSGAFVRVRQLKLPEALDLGVFELKDSFAAQLFKHINGDPDMSAQEIQEAEEALGDKEKRAKFFGPLDRVTAAALICPTAVFDDPTEDDQVHVNDIDLIDKLVIFEASMPAEMKNAALEAQQDALKRVRGESEAVIRDLPDGDAVPSEAE